MLFKPAVPESGALKTVLAFPNTYSIGITSLGYQIIWSTLSQRRDVNVKRLFTDQNEISHHQCDLFGISLSWELDGPTVLNLLEKQKIPIWSNDRKENDPIVFGGGPVLTANPEPFAPFFDVILLGDGENLLPSFIDTIQDTRKQSRYEIFKALAQIPGIYIPSLYKPIYTKEGDLININPIHSDIPQSISKQTWRGNSLSHSTVITPEAAWPNIHMVEVVRSCPELCRFCMASYLTLPFRTPSLEEGLIPAIEKGLTATNRIGLLGASVTQHPQFADLINWLNQSRFDNIRLSVSSVRASTVNAKMTSLLSRHGSKSLTIAIESGSERIRRIINKKLSEEEIFVAAKAAKEGGLQSMKLYGMVGLPGEQEEDIQATIDLLLKLKKSTPGFRLTLGISTFVPKAHTPFQWHGLRPEAKNRIKLLEKKLRSNGIDVRPESFGWSVIQALFSRSDRRLAPVIATMKESHNSLGGWKNAYKLARNENLVAENSVAGLPKLPPWEEIVNANWENKKILPWNHLNGPLTKDQLIEHQQDAIDQL